MSYKTELQSNNIDLEKILDMILALGLVDAPKLITFTIADISYQAEEGMTWEEWFDSEYNTSGRTSLTGNTVILNSAGMLPKLTDAIEEGHAYSLYTSSGGGD